jgi:CHASE3 domain sensor protein
MDHTMQQHLPEQQRKANVRLALILASLALVFGLGFVARMWFWGH